MSEQRAPQHANWCESIARECNCGADDQVAVASLPEHDPGKSIPYVDYFGMSNVSQPSPSGDYEKLAEQLILHMINTPSEIYKTKLADWLRSHDAKVRGQTEQRLREALTNIAALPTKDYEISGMDCGNTGDVYEDGWQAGAKCAAGLAEAALQEIPSDR